MHWSCKLVPCLLQHIIMPVLWRPTLVSLAKKQQKLPFPWFCFSYLSPTEWTPKTCLWFWQSNGNCWCIVHVCHVSSWAPHINGGWETECHGLKKLLVCVPAWRMLGSVHCICFFSQAAVFLGSTVVGEGEKWHRWGSSVGAGGRKLMTRCCLAGLHWRKSDGVAGSMAQLKY